jgi:oxygen-independent coproporphyrinogen III oxidase
MEIVVGNHRKKPLKRVDRIGRMAPSRELPEQGELRSLFAKYDVQAPRYTSYPPATQFHSEVGSESYSGHISKMMSSSVRNEISIYVHLPFCDTLCYFCGCTMLISNNREKIAEYIEYLKREITLVSDLLEGDSVVVQMHWGGGSPTHLLPHEIEDLGAHLRRTFSFAPNAECSIEIDPRGVTPEHVRAIQTVGFNRASIGVQDFNNNVQIAINRIQPQHITEQVIGWCREAEISSINLDLIYGLPYQTTQSFQETLDIVRGISPDRIAVYNFAYVPWIKPHQNLIPIDLLPIASSKLALLECAIRELTSDGYEYLGMDHFAKPDDALVQAQKNESLHRNFQGYSTLRGKDLLAFGISAIGRVENRFAQNVKQLDQYYSLLEDWKLPIEKEYVLSDDDSRREYTIMQLMCNLRVRKKEFEWLFGDCFDDYFSEELTNLEGLAEDGLVIMENDDLRVTSLGRYFLRNIAVTFDAYRFGQKAVVYSRAL